MSDEDYSEVASLPINRDYWQRDDKIWTKSREELWKKDIKKRASELLVKHFSGLYVKHDLEDLGNYFVKGDIAPYETMILFVLLWLHPSSDSNVWVDIKKSSDCLSQDFVRRFFYSTSFDVLGTAMDSSIKFSRKQVPDGIVRDRIWPLYSLLVLDNSSKWDEDEKIIKLKNAFKERPKSRYIARLVGGHNDQIDVNDVGQFFIDEWICNLESLGLEKEDKERVESIFISALLHKHFTDAPAVPYESLKKDVFHPESTILIFDIKNHDATVQRNMAKELYERIEGNTNFPAPVSQLWDDTKQKVEDCIKNYKQYLK